MKPSSNCGGTPNEPNEPFGAQDPVFTPDAPRSVATMIAAPAPPVIDGAHPLSPGSHPVQVAATIQGLADRVAASGCR